MAQPIYLRRDTDINRQGVTLNSGEPFWSTDLEELWVGDGVTAGGIFVGSSSLPQFPADQTPNAAGIINIQPANRFSQVTQRVLCAAGAGAYASQVVLKRVTPLKGALAIVYIELPASANPTVQIYDNSTGGTLLQSVPNPNPLAPVAGYFTFLAVYDGAAWHKLSGAWQ